MVSHNNQHQNRPNQHQNRPFPVFKYWTAQIIQFEINAKMFIELCFRVKDYFILTTTSLVVPDFGSVKFLLSISSMNHLNSVMDVSAKQISICKKSFVFKTSCHNRVKAHDTMTIGIKCSLQNNLGMAILLQNHLVHFSTIFLLNSCYNSRRGKAILKLRTQLLKV